MGIEPPVVCQKFVIPDLSKLSLKIEIFSIALTVLLTILQKQKIKTLRLENVKWIRTKMHVKQRKLMPN